jgi:hypothetical protein
MDLTGIIVELRSELENIDEAITSLGKLVDLRQRRAHLHVQSEPGSEASVPVKRLSRTKRIQAGQNKARD